jgi:hypothetical protein
MPSHRMQYKLVEYHYTYVRRPIPGNIGIPIRLAQSIMSNQFIHHNAMHALCFVSCFFACKATTPGLIFDARSYNFLHLHLIHPRGSNPRGLVLNPGATTHWCQELQFFDLFLRSRATTLWLVSKVRSYNSLNLLVFTHEAPTPGLVPLPVGYNPMTYFWCQELQLFGLTLVPPMRLQPQGLVLHTWFCYASAPTLYVLCVHAISHTNHHNSCFFATQY